MQANGPEANQNPTEDTNELEEIRQNLIKFLTFKFSKHGQELEEELESKIWKERFTNWSLIRKVLVRKEHPTEYIHENPKRGVTVILPKRDTEENFQFLKGAAYFPHEMDPRVYQDNWFYDKEVLIKMAYATHHRYCGARVQLVWLDTKFPLLKGHRICQYKKIPYLNEKDYYYELEIPERFHGKARFKRSLEFDPMKDEPKLASFFTHLVHIAKTGTSKYELETKVEQEK